MGARRLKVLLIIEQCNPEWISVPLVGYRYFWALSQLVDVTLVTHERNQIALEKIHPNSEITYIVESDFIKNYYKLAHRVSQVKGRTIWPLLNTLGYPIYAEFNHKVYTQFKDSVLAGDYDIVHALTPMMPRYPVKIASVCKNVPFMIGPVNGGVPFPEGFQKLAMEEFAYFNFFRLVGRFIIPGYQETYKKADYILAGSTYTLNLIKDLFKVKPERMELQYENGIMPAFLKSPATPSKPACVEAKDIVNLLFVGRLVPYKGTDILIEALSQLELPIQQQIYLTIVGDGSERVILEHQVETLQLQEKVHFVGWVAQEQTLDYYRQSDIFCFPSIREFGGAVVLEALANGLPCIVVNNGGIGEYVTSETGFSIDPQSREFVVQGLKQRIETLVRDPHLRQRMSIKAIERAKNFTWTAKAERIVAIYETLVELKSSNRE